MYNDPKNNINTNIEMPLFGRNNNEDNSMPDRPLNSLSYRATLYEILQNRTSVNIFESLEAKFSDNIGNYYMIVSVCFMSLNALCAKLLEDIPTFEILTFRSFFVLIMLVGYIHKIDPNINLNERENRGLILIQSALLFVVATCYIKGINELNLSEAIAILYTTPLFIGILDWLVRGTTLNLNELTFVAAGFIGVFIIIKGESDEEIPSSNGRLWGGILCLIYAGFNAFGSVMLKVIPQNIHPLAMVTYSTLVSLVFSLIGGLLFENWYVPEFGSFFGLFFMAVFFFLGQFFVVKSIQMVNKSGNVTILNYLQIIIALTFDILLLSTKPTAMSLIGTIITVGVCIHISMKFR